MPSDPLLRAIVGSTPAREEEPAPEPRLRRAFRQMGQSVEEGAKGINRGLTTDLLGAPVDMLNTLLRAVDDTRILPQRFSTQQPVGGGDWWHDKFRRLGLAHAEAGSPSEAGGRLLGGFLNPETAPMALAVLVGARAMKNAPVNMRAQFEAGRAALEAGEDPARVHRLYNVGKTKEGDYYFEPPMMQTEAAAVKQFENLYPDVKLRVLRNQGERSGYFYPTREGGEVFAQGQLDKPLGHPQSRRTVLEHELQHAVDAAEGRSFGARPGVDYLNNPWKDPSYTRNAAEVRARAAEARLDPDMRQFPLVATEPVPRELQIVKQDPRAVAAAVKEPGGMWHPEAVERLAQPLFSKLQGDTGVGVGPALRISEGSTHPKDVAIRSAAQWSDRAIRNYLNRYAGTERDPLKDVEVPFGDGVKRWEELTDATFRGTPGKELGKFQAMQNERFDGFNVYDAFDRPVGETFRTLDQAREYAKRLNEQFSKNPYNPFKNVKPEERVWHAENASRDAKKALTSYLSHVGDYLRQNVPADKLGQYDLVRAVRETAVNDARVARQMEQAAAAGMKDLPVYKEYPDGFRWVELKLPERLTPEQAKQVKREVIQKDEEVYGDAGDLPTQLNKGDVVYVAVDAQGKPLKNSYTGQIVRAASPEEAWLAGRLAEEGNTMGHCVGGYCEPVAAGESRIFSLRDGKGKAHVTVETMPVDEQSKAAGLHYDSIIQIKGKQNRAPNKEYLPYVQDFVRSGKWGEVGDLGNTGLLSTKAIHPDDLRMYNPEMNPQAARQALQRLLQDKGDYLTKDEFNQFLRNLSKGFSSKTP